MRKSDPSTAELPAELAGSAGAGIAVPRKAVCPAASSPEEINALHRRVHELVHQYMSFVWRSLRHLGVLDVDCDDGCQRVWVVVAQKIGDIEPDKVRSYIFSVVVRVASEMRRNHERHQHVEFDERLLEPVHLDAERLVEQQRARQLIGQLLSGMSWELRTVFMMFEVEGLSSLEIANALGLSRGTVASRLRLARNAFQRAVQRQRARVHGLDAQLRTVSNVGPSSRWW